MDELLSTVIEALALNKERLDDLESTLDLTVSETKTNQDEIVKLRERIQKQIEDLAIQSQKLLDKAISSIKFPEIEEIDYKKIEASVKTQIDNILVAKDKDIVELKTELNNFLVSELEKYEPINGINGSDGVDGRDADNDLIISELKQYIEDNKSQFKGDNGKDAPKAKDGINGEDGVGIEDIREFNETLIVKLTNGVEKSFRLPSIIKNISRNTVRGGGGSDLIVSIDSDTNLEPKSQTVLVDATSGNITVKLPDPFKCINSEYSYRIAITRKDLTTNTVTIIPFNTELILNESSQDLFPKEIINLITDGTNWYYSS